MAPADEVARLAALQRYRGLVTNDERDFDLLVSVAAELTGCPRACITFVDRERVWSKAVVGMPHFELPRAHDYCGLTIAEVHGLDIPDLLADPRTREMPATRGDRAHRMYSGVNLVTPDGHRICTLCVLDTRPRQLPARQRELLERLAAQV
ncbi:MAG: GAF domain-containing protein, partial [Burkholderiales bacterium]|nr:GAF domain-containing protein [Burkholderiales bacterium]